MTSDVELADRIRALVGEDLRTKTGLPFRVLEVTGRTVLYEINGVPRAGQVASYERAVQHVRDGNQIHGPGDMQALGTTRNAAYEWAVLKRLEIVS